MPPVELKTAVTLEGRLPDLFATGDHLGTVQAGIGSPEEWWRGFREIVDGIAKTISPRDDEDPFAPTDYARKRLEEETRRSLLTVVAVVALAVIAGAGLLVYFRRSPRFKCLIFTAEGAPRKVFKMTRGEKKWLLTQGLEASAKGDEVTIAQGMTPKFQTLLKERLPQLTGRSRRRAEAQVRALEPYVVEAKRMESVRARALELKAQPARGGGLPERRTPPPPPGPPTEVVFRPGQRPSEQELSDLSDLSALVNEPPTPPGRRRIMTPAPFGEEEYSASRKLVAFVNELERTPTPLPPLTSRTPRLFVLLNREEAVKMAEILSQTEPTAAIRVKGAGQAVPGGVCFPLDQTTYGYVRKRLMDGFRRWTQKQPPRYDVSNQEAVRLHQRWIELESKLRGSLGLAEVPVLAGHQFPLDEVSRQLINRLAPGTRFPEGLIRISALDRPDFTSIEEAYRLLRTLAEFAERLNPSNAERRKVTEILEFFQRISIDVDLPQP